MAYLHEIIDDKGEYLILLGLDEWVNKKGTHKCLNSLYVYNLTAKQGLVYNWKQPHLKWRERPHPILMSEIEAPESTPTTATTTTTPKLPQQMAHEKSPLSQLFRNYIDLEQLWPFVMYNNGVIGTYSFTFTRFKAILISAGECCMRVEGYPGKSINDRIQDDVRMYIRPTQTLGEEPRRINIDVYTPHNIARKMIKIWRKVDKAECDLDAVFNI